MTTPGALTREQFPLSDSDFDMAVRDAMTCNNDPRWHEYLVAHNAALRATIRQQAQELAERERKLVGLCHAHGTALIEIHDLKQQLAASQARCRELEEVDLEAYKRAWKIDGLREQVAQLQATLAAREAEVDRLKLAQQHSIQDECEAEQRLIDAGISDYEDGGQGEYRGLLTQIDLCIKERDAAVQETGRLREALTKLVDESMASDFNEHWDSYKDAQRALKGA